MRKKTTFISIHVDGYYGLIDGVPTLLNLFDKYNIKATFFVNMGKEASIFEILKYRTKELKSIEKNVLNRYNKIQFLRMALFPHKLGCGNFKILREIEKKGHEVQPHCWSHLLWTRNFENLDIRRQFYLMIKNYKKCFNKNPLGFVPPTWKYNPGVLEEMKKFNFKYLGIKNKLKKSELKKDILFIPLSFNKNPEELLNEGLNKKQILEIYKKESKKNYVNWYFHADFEGIKEIKLLEEILKLLNGREFNTYGDILTRKTLLI